MFDRIAALTAAALIHLATLPLSASALIGVEVAHRSSLTGYDVGGQHGLDAVEAAQVLAERAVAEMDAAAAARPAPRLHHDLVKGPHKSLGGICEVWRVGDAANRRWAALEQTEVRPYLKRSFHQGSRLFGHKSKVEIYYPAGRPVPAIEVVS